jgi:hypothetical protein
MLGHDNCDKAELNSRSSMVSLRELCWSRSSAPSDLKKGILTNCWRREDRLAEGKYEFLHSTEVLRQDVHRDKCTTARSGLLRISDAKLLA